MPHPAVVVPQASRSDVLSVGAASGRGITFPCAATIDTVLNPVLLRVFGSQEAGSLPGVGIGPRPSAAVGGLGVVRPGVFPGRLPGGRNRIGG